MKIRNVIRYVDAIKPNAFGDEVKVQWINEAEGYVQTDVMMLALSDVVQYDPEQHIDAELLVKPPHDKLYAVYLCAMVDFANGEYDKYANTMQMYNEFLGEYIKWYTMNFRPADGRCVREGYYLSAYSIAVLHGFEGTEEEWLESIGGPPGKSAYEEALEHGYQGTREEFGSDQARFAENAQTVRKLRDEAADSESRAASSASAAKQSADDAAQNVRSALAEAKESGEFDGPPGKQGETGKQGEPGNPGVFIGKESDMPAGTRVRVDPKGKRTKIPQIDDSLTQPGYAADAAAVGEALRKKLSGDELPVAVNDALRLAKESGEFDGEPGKPGEPGVSPHIGANGNWFIGEMDTGVPARVDTDEFASKQEVTKLSKEKANLTAVPNAASVDGKTLKMQRITTTTAEDGTETTETKDLFDVELPEGGGDDVVRKTGWNSNKYLGTNEDGVVVEKPAPDGTGGEITEEVTKLKNRLFKVDGDLCVEFEQGGLSGADYKTENTSMYWIRSTEYIKREYIKSASVNDGYRIWSYHYDANMNYVGFNNNGIASPASAGVYVRVLINRNDGVTPESDHGFSVVSTVNDLGKQIETATFETRMANCVVEMEQGTLTHIGGNEYDATHYIRNKGFIPYNSAYKITANPEYSGYVFLYDEEKQPIEVLGGASYCAKLPVGFGEYEIPYHENAVYVRFSIQNSTGTAITPTDNHGVRLHGASRYRYERDRIVRNFLEQIRYQMPIVSACVGTTSAGHFKTDIGAVCITDLHGVFHPLDDAYQVRANIASCNMGGDLPILNAGDMFPDVAKENGVMVSAYNTYIEKAVAYGVYHTIGQHEVGYYDTEEGRNKARCLTHDEVFDKFISPMKGVWELPDLTTNYYCKDFVASKTRLISLYQYNIPLIEETSDRWTYPRAAVWYGQDQLDWLVNTLSSTPDGYRVIILMHQPEKDIVRSDEGGFFTGESVGGGNIIIDGTPIVDILDAYATRTSLSKTYVCKDKTRYPESDFSNTVNADFSASKGLFCNYITGDAHVDYIGVVEGTGQNNIGLTSSGQCYDAVVLSRNYGTIASEGNNPESSIVTVLGYDHNRRMIRIGRLGQQFASDGSTRMYTAISY